MDRLPEAQAAEIRRLPNPKLREKVVREVLSEGLSEGEARQLVNGLLQLKNFPPTPSLPAQSRLRVVVTGWLRRFRRKS